MSRPLVEHFELFVQTAGPDSPLYAALSQVVVERPSIAAPLDAAMPGQAKPVLLFAAIHHLLLSGVDHDLALWYPTLMGDEALPPDDPDLAAAVVDFLAVHDAGVRTLVSSRSVQTNEVNRAAVLRLLFEAVQMRSGLPLSLIEVGASAGLNLNLDRFRVSYSGAPVGGSGPDLRCEFRGSVAPAPLGALDVASRIGLDPSPIDVADPAARDWLRACLWGDQPERLARLDAAVEIALASPPPLVRGDAVADVGRLVTGTRPDTALVVFHSWVMTYLARDDRAAFVGQLAELSESRPIWWVAAEGNGVVQGLAHDAWGPDTTVMGLVELRGGGVAGGGLVGRCHHHGNWAEFSIDPLLALAG